MLTDVCAKNIVNFRVFRYDSEEDIENTEPLPAIEKKERVRDKSLRKKPIDARDEDDNADFYPTGNFDTQPKLYMCRL